MAHLVPRARSVAETGTQQPPLLPLSQRWPIVATFERYATLNHPAPSRSEYHLWRICGGFHMPFGMWLRDTFPSMVSPVHGFCPTRATVVQSAAPRLRDLLSSP